MTWRWANDSWNSQQHQFTDRGPLKYDKVQHFIGGYLFGLFSWRIGLAFWFAWEIKDALIPWERGYVTMWPIEHNWGGDGFSWRDMLASWTGVGCGYLTRLGISFLCVLVLRSGA